MLVYFFVFAKDIYIYIYIVHIMNINMRNYNKFIKLKKEMLFTCGAGIFYDTHLVKHLWL
jgi:hypothetical protein